MGRRAKVAAPPFDAGRYHGGAHVDLVEPGTVTFILTAPYKPYVSVVGEFNGWDIRAQPMFFDGDRLWWVTVPLSQPTRYQFYVEIDDVVNRVRVGDPYAREVQWDNNGPNAYLSFARPYVWQDAGWQPPSVDDLVIYEINVRDFGGQRQAHADLYGTFADVADRLPYLRDIGINAIELLPVAQFPMNSAWGNNPVFFMAPERTYGAPHDLKALVDAAHRHGIAVILDLVLNKGWQDHPYYLMYPPMLSPDGRPLTDWNPFFRHSWHGDESSVRLDCFADLALTYLRDVVRFWLEEYHVDGLRFDGVAALDFDPENPRRPNFEPERGIAALAGEARAANPQAILIADYTVVSGTNPAKSAVRLVTETAIDAVWCEIFPSVMANVLAEGWQWEREPVHQAIAGCLEMGFSAGHQLVKFLANHRTTRPVHTIKFHAFYQVQPHPSVAGNYVSSDDIAMRKARLGLLTLFTAVGTPMLLAGEEFVEDSGCTVYFNPVDWRMLERAKNQRHLDFVRQLVRLRHAHPALRSASLAFSPGDFATEKLICFRRWHDSGDVVLVVLNFDHRPRQVSLVFPQAGRWREALSGATVEVAAEPVEVTVAEWDGLIFAPAMSV
ncbi:MAG: alpha-amylase family glycosyl hydrolase [Chloroflexota bacterium]